jgi:hypothetical protein
VTADRALFFATQAFDMRFDLGSEQLLATSRLAISILTERKFWPLPVETFLQGSHMDSRTSRTTFDTGI